LNRINYKFTGYERDTETGNDYAFARYYSQVEERFLSPDPLDGDASDPQTLNKYAYVRNNPVNSIDPSGMFIVILPPPDPGFFIDDPGFIIIIDIPLCGSGGYGSSQYWVSHVPWIIKPPPKPSQVNAPKGQPPTPSRTGCMQVPVGTQSKYCGALQQGLSAAKKALKKKSCDALYGGQGGETLGTTEYRFLDMGDPTTGAATIDPNNVFINSNGPYMTYTPTPGQVGPFGRFWTQDQFRGFILLHELGHQLSSITGFVPDAGSPLNEAQSGRVVSACF
jgi:RHS repeat-associated protein